MAVRDCVMGNDVKKWYSFFTSWGYIPKLCTGKSKLMQSIHDLFNWRRYGALEFHLYPVEIVIRNRCGLKAILHLYIQAFIRFLPVITNGMPVLLSSEMVSSADPHKRVFAK